MVFRGIQAAGSSATISIGESFAQMHPALSTRLIIMLGTGVICDITTKKERGGYMGTFGSSKAIRQN